MSLMRILSKGHFLYIGVVMHALLTTSTKLLKIKYRFYGCDGDLIDINNQRILVTRGTVVLQ